MVKTEDVEQDMKLGCVIVANKLHTLDCQGR
jgi:hypothetical protein